MEDKIYIATPPAPKSIAAVEDRLQLRIKAGEASLTKLCEKEAVADIVNEHAGNPDVGSVLAEIQRLMTTDVVDQLDEYVSWANTNGKMQPAAKIYRRAADVVRNRFNMDDLQGTPLQGIVRNLSDLLVRMLRTVAEASKDKKRDTIEPLLNSVDLGKRSRLELQSLLDPPTPKNFVMPPPAAPRIPTENRIPTYTPVHHENNGEVKKRKPATPKPRPVVAKPAPRPKRQIIRPPKDDYKAPHIELPEYLTQCTSPAEGLGINSDGDTALDDMRRRSDLIAQREAHILALTTPHPDVQIARQKSARRRLVLLCLGQTMDRREWLELMDPEHERYDLNVGPTRKFPAWMNHMDVVGVEELMKLLRKRPTKEELIRFFGKIEHPISLHQEPFLDHVEYLYDNNRKVGADCRDWLAERLKIDETA